MNTRHKNKKIKSGSITVGSNQKTSHSKGTTSSLGERSSPNTQMPPLYTTVGIQGYENNSVVTPIDRSKVNPTDSRTYVVGDMNDRHSPVYGTAYFLHRFDQNKDSCHNIDRNNHNEERGSMDDDGYDYDDVLSLSS